MYFLIGPTILNTITNMENLSSHAFGKADPTSILVVGTPLCNETFGQSYVPQRNYEDPQITPYKVRLQQFSPPQVVLVKTHPEIPRENVETKVIVYPQTPPEVASAWLCYSLNGSTPAILKMVSDGETAVGSLGSLEGTTTVFYEVILQDFFFNTHSTLTGQAIQRL